MNWEKRYRLDAWKGEAGNDALAQEGDAMVCARAWP